jgi:hypothetical protein
VRRPRLGEANTRLRSDELGMQRLLQRQRGCISNGLNDNLHATRYATRSFNNFTKGDPKADAMTTILRKKIRV